MFQVNASAKIIKRRKLFPLVFVKELPFNDTMSGNIKNNNLFTAVSRKCSEVKSIKTIIISMITNVSAVRVLYLIITLLVINVQL